MRYLKHNGLVGMQPPRFSDLHIAAAPRFRALSGWRTCAVRRDEAYAPRKPPIRAEMNYPSHNGPRRANSFRCATLFEGEVRAQGGASGGSLGNTAGHE